MFKNSSNYPPTSSPNLGHQYENDQLDIKSVFLTSVKHEQIDADDYEGQMGSENEAYSPEQPQASQYSLAEENHYGLPNPRTSLYHGAGFKPKPDPEASFSSRSKGMSDTSGFLEVPDSDFKMTIEDEEKIADALDYALKDPLISVHHHSHMPTLSPKFLDHFARVLVKRLRGYLSENHPEVKLVAQHLLYARGLISQTCKWAVCDGNIYKDFLYQQMRRKNSTFASNERAKENSLYRRPTVRNQGSPRKRLPIKVKPVETPSDDYEWPMGSEGEGYSPEESQASMNSLAEENHYSLPNPSNSRDHGVSPNLGGGRKVRAESETETNCDPISTETIDANGLLEVTLNVDMDKEVDVEMQEQITMSIEDEEKISDALDFALRDPLIRVHQQSRTPTLSTNFLEHFARLLVKRLRNYLAQHHPEIKLAAHHLLFARGLISQKCEWAGCDGNLYKDFLYQQMRRKNSTFASNERARETRDSSIYKKPSVRNSDGGGKWLTTKGFTGVHQGPESYAQILECDRTSYEKMCMELRETFIPTEDLVDNVRLYWECTRGVLNSTPVSDLGDLFKNNQLPELTKLVYYEAFVSSITERPFHICEIFQNRMKNLVLVMDKLETAFSTKSSTISSRTLDFPYINALRGLAEIFGETHELHQQVKQLPLDLDDVASVGIDPRPPLSIISYGTKKNFRFAVMFQGNIFIRDLNETEALFVFSTCPMVFPGSQITSKLSHDFNLSNTMEFFRRFLLGVKDFRKCCQSVLQVGQAFNMFVEELREESS